MRRKLIELKQQRAAQLEAAETALKAGKQEDYNSSMEQVRNMNTEIKSIQDLIEEQDRKFLEKADDPQVEKDKAGERGNALMKGEKVTFEVSEVRKALWGVNKSITLATGTLVQPTGAGANIRDNLETAVSSIVDQVQVQDLTGMGSLLEPYVITESDAKGGKVTTNAGTARTASADPTFGVAKIAPYELNVTNYVDRNISRLSPANYYAKIYGMAMRAMRRKLAELIVNGDGQATPDMYGMKNAKNQAGNEIFASVNLSAIDENTLDELFYAYGGDEEIAGNARLFLNKADLKAMGKIRGTADKNRVYKVHPDMGNPNTGMIEDGGNFVPYTIVSALTALSGSTAGAAAIQTMLYGSPMNYILGLFGPYSIRVDDSVKAVERMLTILGDAFVGGNLATHYGMVVGTLPATG
ncbi:MAG TPA: phage major capsid protein [Candidatus Enterenecus stercoripullorum]|nr:phage major capsid protein [Candidatus Enterenecus stercoripullorum]